MLSKLKSKYKILIILILISIFACIPYLDERVIEGNDTAYHLNRIIGLSNEIKYGNVFGLIHSNLKQNFGYGNGLFYPQLFIYIPAILNLLFNDVVLSYKIFILIITLATSFITYYSINRIVKSEGKSVLITFLYVASTYRLGDIYVRSALGEVLAFTFIPLILTGLYEILYGDNKKWWLICIGIFGVVNSHVLTAVLVLLMIFIFCIINCKKIFTNKEILKNLIIAGIVSILLSISFILPYLEISKSDTFNFEVYDNSKFLFDGASNLQDLLKSHLSDVGKEFTISIPYLILAVLLLLSKEIDKKNDVFIIHSYIVATIFLIFSTKLMPWKHLSIFSILQFPFRFSIIFSILFAYICGESIYRYFKDENAIKFVEIILVCFVGFQLSSANVNMNDSSYDAMINNYPLGLEEYSPLGLDVWNDFVCDIDDEPLIEKDEIFLLKNYITSDGNIIKKEDIPTIEFTRSGPKVEFYYDKEKNINLHIPLTYYKGYVAYIENENGVRQYLNLNKEEKNANIIISSNSVIKGKVVVEYKMTKIQKISYFISFITLIGLIVFIKRSQK